MVRATVILKALLIWIVGLLSVVPYATYYLFFEADRSQYAFLITLILFWVFGYWGVAGPLIATITVRRVFRAIEGAKSREELIGTLRSDEARDVAIDMIATEHGVPKFIAARVYRLLIDRFSVCV